MDDVLTPDALLAHADWVERLARRLVRDETRAADVVQETWLAALERPPRGARPRAWLGTVVRNAARRQGRDERARSAREREAARPAATTGVEQAAARATLSREVVGDVLALDEPYRGVVLLRWFEDLPPREIARRLGRPVETVKTQLQRGHADLRARLAARHGELPLGAALAPLLAPRARPLVPPLAMAALAGAVLALLAVAFWPREPEERAAASLAGIGVQDGAAVASPARDRPLVRFVDAAGEPVAGITVRLNGTLVRDQTCLTDENGVPNPYSAGSTGSIGIPNHDALQGEFEATGIWAVVADGWIHAEGEPEERVVVVARTVEVHGQVTAGGQPVPRARLSVQVRPEGLPRLPFRLSPIPGRAEDLTHEFWTIADDEGRYAFEVPAGPDFLLLTTADGHGAQVGWCPPPRERRVSLHRDLEPSPRPGAWISGVVVDERGCGVPGAVVDFGHDGTRSDANGRFRLDLTGLDREHVLTALAPGRRPARRGGLSPLLRVAQGRLQGLALVLEAAPLSIRGQVVDAQGTPCPGWFVVLRDGTPFGSYGSSIEHEASGADGIGVTTDAQGLFELGGLMDREYEVLAHDEDGTYVVLVARRVRAGTHDLVLAVPEDALLPAEVGQVLDPRGQPLAGHTVGVSVNVFWNGFTGMGAQGRGVTTDGEGRFVLRGVPWREVELAVWGPDVPDPVTFPFGAAGVPLELVVPVTYRFVLDVDERSDVTAVELRTARGEVLEFHVHQPGYVGTRTRLQLAADGRRNELSVKGEATTLVLFTEVDGQVFEIDRVPLSLERGEKPVVRR